MQERTPGRRLSIRRANVWVYLDVSDNFRFWATAVTLDIAESQAVNFFDVSLSHPFVVFLVTSQRV